jgi:hypothetical protein
MSRSWWTPRFGASSRPSSPSRYVLFLPLLRLHALMNFAVATASMDDSLSLRAISSFLLRVVVVD